MFSAYFSLYINIWVFDSTFTTVIANEAWSVTLLYISFTVGKNRSKQSSYGEVLMHEREKTVLQVQHQAFDDSTPANQHSLDLSGGIKSERQPLWNEDK